MTTYYAGKSESLESIVTDLAADDDLAAAAASMQGKGAIELADVEAMADSAPVRKLLNIVLLTGDQGARQRHSFRAV